MWEKFFNFFKSKKRKFQQQTKKEKNRLYQREKKIPTIYGKKRLASRNQLHINFGFKRRSIIAFSLIWIISTVITIVFLFRAEYFSIQNITIESPDSLTDINIAYNSIDSLRNKNIFRISHDKVLKKLQTYQPNISNISLEKQLPNAIKIITTLYPISLYAINEGQTYAISSNGVAIKQKWEIKNQNIQTIEIIENKKSSFLNINYTKILEPSTITKISFLLRSFQDNLALFPSDKIQYYSRESEIHILLKNKTLLIFDSNWDIIEQIKKLIVFHKETKNLKKIYIDLRIPNKVFHCDYDTEYQCRKNLKKLYTKK